MVELLDAAMEERRKLDRQDTINRLLQAEQTRGSPLEDEDLSDDVDLEFECDTSEGLRLFSKRNKKLKEKISLFQSELERLDDEWRRLSEEERELKVKNATLLQCYEELRCKYLKQTSENVSNNEPHINDVVSSSNNSSIIEQPSATVDEAFMVDSSNIKQETSMNMA